MSDKTDQDEEGISGSGVTVVETNRFGFILGNGETDSDGPCPELVRHRETKWLGLIKQWEQVMEKKSNKVKSQCQKGIPASVRAKCWPLLCGAMERREKNAKLYERLVEALDQQGWTDIIKRDTDRQFPFHEMFQSKDGHGQKDLLHVLKAYTQYRPEEGYCQAQGPVAAVLLMNMPAEEAFWCLVQISELYLPGYYSPLLEGVLFDAAVLSSVLKKQCPAVHKHLQNQGVEPLMFATDWLMCLYSRHLPFNTLLRVWDLFFCYGVRILFQVAVALVRRCLGEARIRKECDGQMETLERLRGVKERIQNVQADTFIHEVCSVPLSLVDLQKQTEKEMEKWKLERPNSTFDPRGRCHGYRMAWERGQEKLRKNEKKEQQKGNLTLPLMRSHSSLSPSILRKKFRKRSSRTETEEWDGGGRNVSQGLMEESDDEEIRRKSVCGVIGEQREKQGRLAHELYTHKQKDHNTHTTIPPQKPKVLVVSYSIESNVFEEGHEDRICAANIQIVTKRDSVKHEDTLHTDTGNCKEKTEVSLNQHNDTSATGEGKYDDKERIAASVLEEDIQTHEHHEPNVEKETCQVQNTENKTNQNEQRTKEQTNQDEQNTEKHTCQDEHNVEIRITSESSEESIQTNYYAQVVDVQTTTGKQEEEIQSWGFKRDGAETDTLQKVIIPEDNQQDEENRKNLENITEAEGQIPVFQEDRRSHTSRDQYEEQPIGENYTDVGMEEAGHIVVGDGEIPEERKKGKEEERQEAKLEERDSDYHIGDKETLQTSEEQEIEHPNRSVSPLALADPVQQSQSSDSEHNDMDATERSSDSQHSQIDSKEVEVILRSGNPEQSVEGASGRTDSHETWEEDLAVASKNSEDIIMNAASVAMCCSIETSEINTDLCERNKTTESENIKCCEMDTSKDSPNLENKREDGTCKSGNSECINTTVSGNPESDAMESANGSGNPDCKKVDVSTEFHNPKRHQVHVGTGSDNPESDAMESADGCGNSECTNVHVTSESSNNEVQIGSLSGNPESSEVHVGVDCTQVAIGSSNHESNLEHSVVGSGNPECKDEHATSESSDPESSKVFVGSGNPECTQVTIRSGNHESTVVDSAVASGNPECNIVDSADGSGNSLHNSVCAIPDNQDLETQSKTTSKPSMPNIPPTQHRVGRTSSSRSSYPTILSEDTFRVPKQTHTPKEDITQETHTQLITGSSTKPGAPKSLGLFSRLRGETNKTPVPKIFIQDISEKEEKLTAKERRRRKRESERKEREERKKREKQTEKERKNPQMSGKSFQVLNMECWDNDVSPNNTDSKTLCHRRNSAPFSDSYF